MTMQVRGLFKGMASPIAGAGVINAILFAAYGQTKHVLAARHGGGTTAPVVLSIPEIAFAGGVAGLVNCAVAGPIELVKTQLQIQYSTPSRFVPAQTDRSHSINNMYCCIIQTQRSPRVNAADN